MADQPAAAAGQQRHQLTDVELEAVRRFEEKVVRIHPGRDPRNPQRMLYRVVAFVGPGANLTTATASSKTSTSSSSPQSASKRGSRQSQATAGGTDTNENEGENEDEEGQSYYDAAEDDDDETEDDDENGRTKTARTNRQASQQQTAPRSKGRTAGKQPAASDARDADEDDVNAEKETITFGDMEVLGAGSFGSVYRITLLNDASFCAIKKVFQDVRYKNRELSIMRRLKHENVVKLRYYFYTKSSASSQQHQQQQQQQHDSSLHGGLVATAAAAAAAAAASPAMIPGVDLNLILEFVPETLYAVVKHFYSREKRPVPPVYTAVFMYQVFKALNYLHNCHGICHRDIKPQNILCSIETGVCKVCDFGSAKRLRDGEANVAYICSRYYRAPELIFGLQFYTCSIDLWSTACVMAEVMLGSPIFPGNVPIDQIVEIIKIRGTPTADEIMAMNPKYENRNLPQVQRRSLRDIFPHPNPHHSSGSTSSSSSSANHSAHPQLDTAIFDAEITLLDQLFSYDPARRPGGLDILLYPLFDCIRLPDIRLPNGRPIPPQIFYFTRWEQSCMRGAKIRTALMPEHTRRPQAGNGAGSGTAAAGQSGSKRGSPPGMDELDATTAATSSAGPTRRRSSRQQQQAAAAITPANGTADGRNPPLPTPRPAGGSGGGIASAALGAAASIAGSIRRRASGGGSKSSSSAANNIGSNSGEFDGSSSQHRRQSYHNHQHRQHDDVDEDMEADEDRQQQHDESPPYKSSSRRKKRSKG